MERVTTQQVAMMPIEFKLNGQTVVGRPDEKIIETAKKHGIEAFMHSGVLCDHWLGTNKFPPHW